MLKDHLFIVFAVEHYNTLDLIRSLGIEGIRPIYIAIKGKANIASSSKYIEKTYFVDSQADGYKTLLNNYGDESEKPFLYCADDKTQSFLDNHYEEIKDKFYFFNAGAQGRINKFMEKYNILKAAEACGFNILKSIRCKKGEIPEEIEYPIITKSISPVVGGWKKDVNICNSEEELKNAYKTILADEVLIQQYIDKKNELDIEGFSINRGSKLIETVTYNCKYLINGYYSPYMDVRYFDDKVLFSKLEQLIKLIGFEGIFETEFLVSQDNTIYFSEINFRTSPWTFLATSCDMNIPYEWANATLTKHVDERFLKPFDGNKVAMVEPIDYGIRVKKRGMSFADWITDFKNADITFYCNKDDPEPFRVMMENWEKLQ